MIRGIAQSGISRDRDVVLFDQRGAGLSEPALCPGFRLPPVTDYTTEGRASFRAQIQECVQSLRDNQIDPAQYSTRASAEDVRDLREALGYSMWDIFGESYGGRLAQEVMRLDSSGIRAVVLSSPTIIGPGRAETPVHFERAFGRVVAACKASESCTSSFPTVAEDFHAVFAALEGAPLAVSPATAGEAPILLDGERVAELIRRMQRAPNTIALIPLMLHELHRGNRLRAARELLRIGSRTRILSATLFLVECYDQYGAAFERVLTSSMARVAPPFRQRLDLECDLWQDRFAPDSARTPVEGGIPTLVITGAFDPVAPPEWGRTIAATLSRSYYYEIPGESHDQNTACRSAIIFRFLANPYQQPDSSCIDTIPRISFATRWQS
jgi:pimeloyl-ACP methyl ester carboxylesterase